MNKYYFIFLVALLSCKKIKPPENTDSVERGFWLDAIAVTKQTVVSVTGNTTTFKLEVAAMQNGELTTVYPDQMFRPDTLTGSIIFSPVSVQRITLNEQRSFQTVLLIDASCDDWAFVDDGGFIDAINRLKKLTGKSGATQHFGVGFFARDEYSGQGPVKFFRNGSGSLFQQTDNEMMQFLAENYVHINDANECSVYDAIDRAADELIANPLSANRSITVMLGNLDDGESAATLTGILQKCAQNNISVNLVLQGVATYDLFRLAHETGGFISDNGGTAASSSFGYNTSRSVLFHVHELLEREGPRYELTCTVTKPSPWYPNVIVKGYLTAYYFEETGGEFISSDLDVNQRLPVYFKIP